MAWIAGSKVVTPMQLALGKAASLLYPDAGLNTAQRVAMCLGQQSVETGGFNRLIENLNYSARRLTEVWPGRFPTLASALPYAHNPEALANKTYGGRFGNKKPGDGYKYRGRGTKQTTFYDNYLDVQTVTGFDVINNPDQLADSMKGSQAGVVYWTAKDCNRLADTGNIEALTRRVNGGVNGLVARTTATNRALSILK